MINSIAASTIPMAGVRPNIVNLSLLHAYALCGGRAGFAQASAKPFVESAPSDMATKGPDLLLLAVPQPKLPGGGL